MIAEDYFNSEEIMNKINKRIDTYKEWNNKRIDIYKEWNYKDDKQLRNVPTEVSFIAVETNETSEITFVSLIIDMFSINNSSIDFYFNHTFDKTLFKPFIFNFDLSNNKGYHVSNNGLKYFYPINKSLKLSPMLGIYKLKDIHAFNIASKLRIPSNLIVNKVINYTLTVRYTQQN